jgi:hypothetical protein
VTEIKRCTRPRCKRDAAPDRRWCKLCLDAAAKQKAARRARRHPSKCIRCSIRPARAGKSECKLCVKLHRKYLVKAVDIAAKAGKCVKCHRNKVATGYRLCRICIDDSVRRSARRRELRRKQGKCGWCGSEREDSRFSTCSACRQKSSARWAARYPKICKKCGTTELVYRLLCGPCRSSAEKATIKRYAKRRRAALRARGDCAQCGRKPESGYRTCRSCIDSRIRYNRAHRKPRAPKVPITHCKRGHRFDEENTYRKPDGSRQCKQCLALASDRYRRRKLLGVCPPQKWGLHVADLQGVPS